MQIIAICDTCRHQHVIDFDPQIGPAAAFSDWTTKHAFHEVDFIYPRRSHKDHTIDHSWMNYIHNADVKVAYGSSAAYTCGLESTPLASSATWVLGRESTAIDNTSNKYLDYLAGGKITVGTTPTTNTQIEVWAYANVNDTPTYPDVLDGTDSDETFTTVEMKWATLKLLQILLHVGTTSNRTFWWGPVGVASAYGGVMPKFHGLFITHNTGVALNSTGSNHIQNYTGVYATVT